MKISDVIRNLTAIKEKYGDLPVRYHDGASDATVREICVYDKRGNDAKSKKTAVEAYLHSATLSSEGN